MNEFLVVFQCFNVSMFLILTTNSTQMHQLQMSPLYHP